MAGELELMRKFFFNKMNEDSAFRAAFGVTSIASRIGQGMTRQGASFPVINVRDLGAYRGGALRILNQGSVVWVQHRYLVVAVNDSAKYPSELASIMEGLFELHSALSVTGGVIHHCYMEDAYTASPVSENKAYYEEGAFWIIAAKSA